MNAVVASADAVLEFWFGANHAQADATRQAAIAKDGNPRWFGSDAAFDQTIRERFTATLDAARDGALKRWQLSPRSTLALVLVFDQFSRNIHRGTPAAFDNDLRALALCRDALARGDDRELLILERLFFYLPLEHAEDIEAQARSVEAYSALHDEAPAALKPHTANALEHAREHQRIIADFGRFPHRNLALDRASTANENEWLSAHRGRYGSA